MREVEPTWKAVLASKAMLPLLWEAYPGHPNLLKSYFPDQDSEFPVRHFVKPLFSRNRGGIELRFGDVVQSRGGEAPMPEGARLLSRYPLVSGAIDVGIRQPGGE